MYKSNGMHRRDEINEDFLVIKFVIENDLALLFIAIVDSFNAHKIMTSLIIGIITAAGRESLLQIGFLLILGCFLHNLIGYFLGLG